MAKHTPHPPAPKPFNPLTALLFSGPSRRAAPLLAIVAGVVAFGYWAWSKQAERIASDPLYQISFDRVVLTPPPDWVTTDVKVEAFREASLDPPLSALDPQLAERVAKALAFHPWVAEVQSVRKVAPDGLEANIVYRRPVCMVELPPTPDGKRGLYAVDVEGTLLPSRDFLQDPKKAAQYPRLGGFMSADVGRVGTRWPDSRVIGGAKTAAVLTEAWHTLSLAKIVPSQSSDSVNAAVFELLTQHGSRVLWGHAPGSETSNEIAADKKIAALLRYVQDHKSLEGRDGPQQLDVRGAEIVIVAVKPNDQVR